MDADGLAVVDDLFGHVNANLARDTGEQSAYARELFDELDRDGGNVSALGDGPWYRGAPLAELGTWTENPWPETTYGLDASTTRPIEFNNGLVLDAGYAKIGVAGPDADRSVEERGTLKTVVYHDDPDATVRDSEASAGGVEGEVVRFPDVERSPRLPRRVATAAQHIAESEHLSEHADAVDGVCFIDGSVYPLGVIYWLHLAQLGRPTPAGTWDRPQEILRDRTAFVDAQHDRDLPVLGVVKTSTMDELVSALEDKLDGAGDAVGRGSGRGGPAVPWTRDHQFASEVLRVDDRDRLTYTSWFRQDQLDVDGHDFQELDRVSGDLRHGEPADYRRAFFYVRLPSTGDVFRVEAPALMVSDADRREAVQLAALAEIARSRGVPRAVERADRLARITSENREAIRRRITAGEYARDYNWDGRWSDVDPHER